MEGVTILLSTFNGRDFLDEQLASLRDQTHASWRLCWRDDGSLDGSGQALEAFAGTLPTHQCTPLAQDGRHRGIAQSFLTLLRLHILTGSDEVVAFADQDDIWLPDKLSRGVRALGALPTGRPALYCARQMLVDERARTIGPSPETRRPPAFPASLAQNIATGCTVMLNATAARLIASLRAPSGTLHDWWSYLVVSAAGGEILVDGVPVVLYRQHRRNAVGAPRTRLRRGAGALRRGPADFMALLHQHVGALRAAEWILSPQSSAWLAEIDEALHGSLAARLRLVGSLDLNRQTWAETAIVKLWLLTG